MIEMIKRIVIYFVGVLTLSSIVYLGNEQLLGKELGDFNLFGIYLFFFIFSVLTYVGLELVFSSMPTQAGYLFLVSIFLKLGCFLLVFKDSIFSEENLTFSQRVSVLIALFLFLIIEVLATYRLLNQDNGDHPISE